MKVSQNIAFQNDDMQESKIKKDVKLDSSKSIFSKNKQTKESFDAKIKNIKETTENNKMQAVLLGQEFFNVFKSKVLPQNKGPIEKSIERQIVSKLLQFAQNINNDDNELFGQGSVALITLLLNCVIKIRDRANEMEYTIEQLKKQIKELKINE